MKKTLHNIFFIALASICLASCGKDGLTLSPETQLSPEGFFSTDKELELWTNRFYYGILEDPESLSKTYADDVVGSALSGLQKGTRTASSQSWSFTYLRFVNLLFERDVNCKDAAVRRKYEGVGHFFRALFYYKMVRAYGDVPYYDHVLASNNKDDLNKPRDSRGYVMKKILEDLDSAYVMLPAKWSSNPVYHVSKDAAMTLKSRAALFEGTFRKYHGIANEQYDTLTLSPEWFLAQAADAARVVIDGGAHTLYNGNTMNLAATPTPYREYFLLLDAENSETILSRRYNRDLKVTHSIQFNNNSAMVSGTARFVNHYLYKDGTPIQDKPEGVKSEWYDQFNDRDPRMAQTLQGPGYKACLDTLPSIIDFQHSNVGYRAIKYIREATYDQGSTGETDFPIMRYAEVLLNYAEAKAELGTLTQEDIDMTINVIRDRAGIAHLSLPSTPDPLMKSYYPNASGAQLAAILEVRRERTVELFLEGFRTWDLLRWHEGKWITPKANGGFQGAYIPALGEVDFDRDGKSDAVFYKGKKPSGISKDIPVANIIALGTNILLSDSNSGYLTVYSTENYVWDETKDYLWPIPLAQIQATGGALTQNPGYEDIKR